MPLLKAADFFYTLRFLRLLTTPWEKTNAFEKGIIDKDGKVIKKPESSEEKQVYNSFHKLVFNLKRLLNKIPLGKSTLASYAAALYLIKEHTGVDDTKLVEVIKEATGVSIDQLPLLEDTQWFLNDDASIQEGVYTLTKDMPLRNGETLAKRNTNVVIEKHEPIDTILGVPVFKAFHEATKQIIIVTQEDITL